MNEYKKRTISSTSKGEDRTTPLRPKEEKEGKRVIKGDKSIPYEDYLKLRSQQQKKITRLKNDELKKKRSL